MIILLQKRLKVGTGTSSFHLNCFLCFIVRFGKKIPVLLQWRLLQGVGIVEMIRESVGILKYITLSSRK